MKSSKHNDQTFAARLHKLLVGALLTSLAIASSGALGLDWLDFGHEGRDWGEAVSMSGDYQWISATEGIYSRVYYYDRNDYREFHFYVHDAVAGAPNQVSFSHDGSVYVIANPGTTDPSRPWDQIGSVVAIATTSGDPTPLGQVIYGEEALSTFGHSVDISGDGTTIVVGEPHSFPWDGRSGRAYVYRFQSSTSSWEMLGAPIDGGVRFGNAVSVNYDGSRIIVGAEESQFGAVFNWDSQSETWMQMGSSLSVGCSGSEVSVAISALGDTAAVALSEDCGGSNGGRVGVFRWDADSSDWTSLGQIIEGEANEVIAKPKLNFDGSTLAIAGKGFSNGEGRVRVFDFDNGSAIWAQKGPDITDQFRNPTGYDIDMGIDGEFLIYGYHKASNPPGNNEHQPKRSERSTQKFAVSATVTTDATISAKDLTRIPYGGVFLIEPNSDWVSVATPSVTGSCATRALGLTVFVGPIESACDISVGYQYSVEVTPVTTDGGRTSPAATQVVPAGGYIDFDIIADEFFTLSAVGGTCPGELVGATYTVGPVTKKCSVEPSFELIQSSYTITNLGGIEANLTWNGVPGDATVSHGEKVAFTATINGGYRMVDYTGSCPTAASIVNPVTPPFDTRYIYVGPITSDCSVSIETVNVHEISAVTIGQGSVSPTDIQYVDAGGYSDFRLTPAQGWMLSSVGAGLDDDCPGVLIENVFRVGPTESDCLVRALFEPTKHTVEVLPAQGGTLNPNTDQVVDYGSTIVFTAVPDEGKKLSGYASTCTVVRNGDALTVGPVTASCNLQAQFDANLAILTPSLGASASTADGFTVQVGNYDAAYSWAVSTTAGAATISGTGLVTVTGLAPGQSATVTVTATPGVSVTATGNASLPTYAVTPFAGANGSIIPSSVQTVESDDTATFTLLADSGYEIAAVGGTCGGTLGGTLTGSSYTTDSVTADCTVEAIFSKIVLPTYVVTPSAGANGSISPSSAQTVERGATESFTLTPASGYKIAEVGGTCGGTLSGSIYTTASVTADCTVVASFSEIVGETFVVTPSSDNNGSISPSSAQTVESGASVSFTLSPNDGFEIAGVSGTCGGMLSGSTYTTASVTADCTVVASFSQIPLPTYVITPSVGLSRFLNGSISPASPQTVERGATASFVLTPDDGYAIAGVGGSCGGTLSGSTYTTTSATADCTVLAMFSKVEVPAYAVTPLAGANGSISPSSVQMVESGATTSFTLSPDSGYEIAGVGGTCGGSLSGSTYTTASVTADCTVEAQFQIGAPSVPQAPTITRTDVGDGEIYLWASVTDDGGRPVTSYQASCTDGASTYIGTSTSSSITISGLTNGVAYTCTVTATNSVGTSSASAATDPITPEEQVGGGLPIWLLYQINQ